MVQRHGRLALISLSMLAMAACGGSGGYNDPGGNPVGNRAPTANAGANQNVDEATTVQLAGSGSDADNDPLTYAWAQTAGTTVTIVNGNTAFASFTAPDVTAGAPETLTFQLTVSDGSANTIDTVQVTVSEPLPAVMVSGNLNYEFVPPNANCNGLNFAGTVVRPIRGATVQLLDAGNTVLGNGVAGIDGSYAFNNIDANTMVRIRVRAELKLLGGAPSWDVDVRDNVDLSAAPPPLGTRPLYVVDGALFDTGTADVVRDVTATTGWGGSSYTAARSAAPFAVLDSIYAAMQLVLSVDATANFAALDAFWSVNNTATVSDDIDAGELGTTFYSPTLDALFLVGDASDDTEEFDDHVIVHEWGHYFEDTFSRADSAGGPHAIGESLEATIAFGEGLASAVAAMALDNPIYCDTGAPGTTAGFALNSEFGNFGVQGWFNEWSVTTLLYDLWDTNVDGNDDSSIGFGLIYNTMIGPQAATEAFTTLFTFATELRSSLNAADRAFLDALLGTENVVSGANLDIWATNETNDAGVGQDVLPLYTPITADGSTLNICVNSTLDGLDRHGNNVAEDRYLRITVPVTDTYDVIMATTTATPVTPDPNDRDQSDPDIYLYSGPQFIAQGVSPDDNLETFTTPSLQAGTTYIAFLEEWRFEDVDGAPATYPQRICFDVSFTPTP